jgi:single-strand DNA-binding protein
MTNNHVRLIGYIGKHLSASTSLKGNRRLQMRIATHYATENTDGTRQFHTVWHDVIAWGSIAEWAEGSFVKGSRVLVEGSIEYHTYPDRAGHTRYITRIAAHSLLNLDR